MYNNFRSLSSAPAQGGLAGQRSQNRYPVTSGDGQRVRSYNILRMPMGKPVSASTRPRAGRMAPGGLMRGGNPPSNSSLFRNFLQRGADPRLPMTSRPAPEPAIANGSRYADRRSTIVGRAGRPNQYARFFQRGG